MAVAFDQIAEASFDTSDVTTVTLNLAAAGSARVAILVMSSNTVIVGMGMTVNAVSATQIYSGSDGVAMFYFVAPPTSSVAYTATWTSPAARGVFRVMTFTGVYQAAPIGDNDTVGGSATSATLTLTSAADDMCVDHMITVPNNDLVPDAGQTQRADAFYTNSNRRVANSTEPAVGDGTVMSWTWADSGGFDLKAITLTKSPTQSIAGSLTFVGIQTRLIGKVVSGALTFVGAITKAINLASGFSGSLSFVGTLTRQTGKVLAGALSFSGALVRQTSKAFSGALTFVGTLAQVLGHITLFFAAVKRLFVGTDQDSTHTAPEHTRRHKS